MANWYKQVPGTVPAQVPVQDKEVLYNVLYSTVQLLAPYTLQVRYALYLSNSLVRTTSTGKLVQGGTQSTPTHQISLRAGS